MTCFVSRCSLVAWVGLLCAACAKTDDSPLPPVADASDSGTGEVTPDSGGDAAACTPGAIESRPCGKCGKQKRTCTTAWGDWTACADEVAEAECAIGDTRSSDCGKCGKQKDTCDPTACTWSTGACAGEGECAKGDKETTVAGCAAGEVRERVCSDTCAWGTYGACGLAKGWVAMAASPSGFVGRYAHAAVWTGSAMIVWGGVTIMTSSPSSLGDGATYDLATNTWTKLPAAPTPIGGGRGFPAAVFGGGQLLVWGGSEGTSSLAVKDGGARYDPASKTWSAMSTAGQPSARFGASAVWSTTTSEMIVWGGCTAMDTTSKCTAWGADGAAYDPAADKWTPLPSAPPGFSGRAMPSMAWSGTEVVIWGGGSDAEYSDGVRYDPKTRVWTTIPAPPTGFAARVANVGVWSGTELLLYGGFQPSAGSTLNTGARYKPGSGWSLLPTPDETTLASAKRYWAAGWYGGGKLWVWSGMDTSGKTPSTGAAWDPATDKWTPMDTTGAPTERGAASVVWTGKEAIVWGGVAIGSGAPKAFADGGVFRP